MSVTSGLLLCQDSPYLTEASAAVLTCAPEGAGYAVLLDTALLYPEGGGQPSDHGTVAGLPVRALRKTADGVVHLLDAPVSGQVAVQLDWARRFDHMQQHTGQHLLSALARDRFGLPTLAFHLGPERSDVELGGNPTEAQLTALEEAINAVIREARPIAARVVSPSELATLDVRSRGLPEGFSGDVRLIEIAGIDLNTCGGTHLANTAEIGALKLLGTERLTRGLRLFFAAGGRVLRGYEASLQREVALCRALSTTPDGILAAVERLLADAKAQGKALKAQSRELATLLGAALEPDADGVARLHRPDGDLAFLGAVADAARQRRPELPVLLTAGEREGVFLLSGPEAWVSTEGPRIAERLQGRGGGRGRYQGKAARVDLR